MPLQLSGADFLRGIGFPDVAHHAAAVAAVMRVQNQHGQRFENRIHVRTTLPASWKPGPRTASVRARSTETSTLTNQAPWPSSSIFCMLRVSLGSSLNARAVETSWILPPTMT